MSYQRQPGLLKWFYKIPWPIRIYLGVVLSAALIIGSIFAITEMQNRLNPPSQILLELEDDPPPQTEFLKIYAWESYDEGKITYDNLPLGSGCLPEEKERIQTLKQPDKLRLTEMKTENAVRIACSRIPLLSVHLWNNHRPDDSIYEYIMDWNGFLHTPYTYYNTGQSFASSLQLIAKADAEIEISGNAVAYSNKGSDEYIANFSSHTKVQHLKSSRGSYHVITSSNPYHEINGPDRDPDEKLGSGKWNPDARSRFYYQHLHEVYPDLPSAYRNIRRKVCESAVLFSAYSKTNPNLLLAQAEVKLTFYSCWGYEGEDPRALQGIIFQILKEFGLDTDPNNYGFTTAEIVDYWENYDYTGNLANN